MATLAVSLAGRLNAPAVAASDDFTDTNGVVLEAHTAANGVTWTKHASYASGSLVVQGNRIRSDAAADAVYLVSTVPPNASYDASAVVRVLSVTSPELFAGVVARAATGANTMYRAYLFHDGISWTFQLDKLVAGVYTQLGDAAPTIAAGNDYTIKLSVTGTTITGYLDGTQQAQATDSSISAAGRAGVLSGRLVFEAGTGVHVDSWTSSLETPARPLGGALVKQVRKPLAGAFGVAGNYYRLDTLGGLLFLQPGYATFRPRLSQGGTLTTAGALAVHKQTATPAVAPAGSLGVGKLVGALRKATTKPGLAGTLTTAGGLVRRVNKDLTTTGSPPLPNLLQASGALRKTTLLVSGGPGDGIKGVLTPAGVLAAGKRKNVALAGTLTTAAAGAPALLPLRRIVPAGVLAPAGQLAVERRTPPIPEPPEGVLVAEAALPEFVLREEA